MTEMKWMQVPERRGMAEVSVRSYSMSARSFTRAIVISYLHVDMADIANNIAILVQHG